MYNYFSPHFPISTNSPSLMWNKISYQKKKYRKKLKIFKNSHNSHHSRRVRLIIMISQRSPKRATLNRSPLSQPDSWFAQIFAEEFSFGSVGWSNSVEMRGAEQKLTDVLVFEKIFVRFYSSLLSLSSAHPHCVMLFYEAYFSLANNRFSFTEADGWQVCSTIFDVITQVESAAFI